MTLSTFKHAKISGIKTVIPQGYIDIDNELEYFDNNPKKLERAKKMVGYGRRYIADDLTTVTDMAVDAAEKLIREMKINKDEIDALIFVNQKPDYKEPNDACLAHGRLDLKKDCAILDINMGCSGYINSLWTAFSMIESGAIKNCLLLAGDLNGRTIDTSDRKKAPVFGDAVSASFIEYCAEENPSYFVIGTDGKGWNKIIYPIGGTKIPFAHENIDLRIEDENGYYWDAKQSILKGEDVFNFTMEVAPKLINDTMEFAQWKMDDVDLFSIHQANYQIVSSIIKKAALPVDKVPADIFSKYANNSTTSVVTVLCDQQKPLGKTILCAFGVGLAWGGAALNLTDTYNGGISTYYPSKEQISRQKQIENWIKYFKGEENE